MFAFQRLHIEEHVHKLVEQASMLGEHCGRTRTRLSNEPVDFLVDPPLDDDLKLGYKLIMEAAVATIPARIRDILGVTRMPGAVTAGRAVAAGLRWALGASPSWQLALIRTGQPVPPGRFKQPLPVPAPAQSER